MRWQVVFDVILQGPHEVDDKAMAIVLNKAKVAVREGALGIEIMIRPLSTHQIRPRDDVKPPKPGKKGRR